MLRLPAPLILTDDTPQNTRTVQPQHYQCTRVALSHTVGLARSQDTSLPRVCNKTRRLRHSTPSCRTERNYNRQRGYRCVSASEPTTRASPLPGQQARISPVRAYSRTRLLVARHRGPALATPIVRLSSRRSDSRRILPRCARGSPDPPSRHNRRRTPFLRSTFILLPSIHSLGHYTFEVNTFQCPYPPKPHGPPSHIRSTPAPLPSHTLYRSVRVCAAPPQYLV